MTIKKSDLYRLLWVNGSKYNGKTNLILPDVTSSKASFSRKGKHNISEFESKQGVMQELLTGRTRLV